MEVSGDKVKKMWIDSCLKLHNFMLKLWHRIYLSCLLTIYKLVFNTHLVFATVKIKALSNSFCLCLITRSFWIYGRNKCSDEHMVKLEMNILEELEELHRLRTR